MLFMIKKLKYISWEFISITYKNHKTYFNINNLHHKSANSCSLIDFLLINCLAN